MFSRLDTIPACDGQTDRPDDSKYTLCICVSRSKHEAQLMLTNPREALRGQ